MGQKVHPHGFRLGQMRGWDTRWFSSREYASLLREDITIRKYIKGKLPYAGISKIEISRAGGKAIIDLHTARPGVIIGRRGVEVDKLRDELQEMTGKQIIINIREVKSPGLNPQLLAESIAAQLEKRMPFRRAMKKAVSTAMQLGAKGIKITCSGRLGGAEIARSESYKEGKIPLHTLRADIEYGFSEAHTTYGVIGVKVWIYYGEIIPQEQVKTEAREEEKK